MSVVAHRPPRLPRPMPDADLTAPGRPSRGLSQARLHSLAEQGATPMNTDWMADGKCREMPPTTFFPSDGLGVQAAQRICAGCPVAETCLEYALANRIDHGVWG